MIRELIKVVFIWVQFTLVLNNVVTILIYFKWVKYLLSQDTMDPESEMYQIHVVLVEILKNFLCDWILLYFHYITCSTSVNCFLPMQIHQEIIQYSFCELFYDSMIYD